MGDTVTIDKSHLATLMRRANLHGSDKVPQHDVQPTAESVTVPRQYLEDLHKALREYNALRSALIRGGVTVESLNLLVQETFDQTDGTVDHSASTDAGVPLFDRARSGPPISILSPGPGVDNQYYPGNHQQGYGNFNSPTWNFNNPAIPVHEHGHNSSAGKQHQDKSMDFGVSGHDQLLDQNVVRNGHVRRTVYLTKLPERITYAQVFSVIRGGAVVDVWMKASDHAASVSFVEPSAAENFYQYTRKNDIYIEGRRIQVEWREPSRQFVILNNIMSAISRGATRNLLLSKVPPTLTEARIRDDLEHIHNLHVEKVEIRGGSILVNLNSVCVALFARTCLMSRSSYKGVKIEFAADDCAGRLPILKKKEVERQKVQEKTVPKNRFDILAMAGKSDDDDDDDHIDNDEEDISSDDETEKDLSSPPPPDGHTNGSGHRDRKKDVGSRGGKRAWGDTTNGL